MTLTNPYKYLPELAFGPLLGIQTRLADTTGFSQTERALGVLAALLLLAGGAVLLPAGGGVSRVRFY